MGETLTIRRMGGLGDVAMALCAAHAAKIHGACDRVYFETAPEYQCLADACPWVDPGGSGGVERNLNPAWHGVRPIHEVDSFCETLGLHNVLAGSKSLDLNLPRTRGFGQYILVHPGTTDPNRSLPKEFWRRLVLGLQEAGHKVAIIGQTNALDGRGAHHLEEADLDLVDRLSLLGLAALFRSCGDSVLVSADSGPIQLAGASDIGIVGIYSVTLGGCRLPFRHGQPAWRTVAVDSACPHAPCYRKMTDAKLRENLDLGFSLGQIFSQWCPAGGTYACMHADLLDRVMGSTLGLMEA
jgi:hypothetical protein